MNTNSAPSIQKSARLPRGIIAGGVLVLIGLDTLISNFINLPVVVYLLGLGLIFLAWGIVARSSGLLIPGGILTGTFAGAALITGPLSYLGEAARGGVVLAAFTGGWVLISLLSLYTEGFRKWWFWPLIPAAILGILAITLLAGATDQKQVLVVIGYVVPFILIARGLMLVLKHRS